MKSVKLQLLVTLAAILITALIFAAKGLPPSNGILYCAANGDLGGVRRALNWGVDVRVKIAANGGTPLHWAASGGQKEMGEFLIVKGAEVNATDKDGKTPLHWAALEGRNNDIVELLIAHGASVNAKDSWGGTPLHHAVILGRKEMVELLLAHKAEVNAKTNDGQAPLGFAVKEGHKEIGDLLRQHGAKE